MLKQRRSGVLAVELVDRYSAALFNGAEGERW